MPVRRCKSRNGKSRSDSFVDWPIIKRNSLSFLQIGGQNPQWQAKIGHHPVANDVSNCVQDVLKADRDPLRRQVSQEVDMLRRPYSLELHLDLVGIQP